MNPPTNFNLLGEQVSFGDKFQVEDDPSEAQFGINCTIRVPAHKTGGLYETLY